MSKKNPSIRLISYALFAAGFLYYCIFPVAFLFLFPENPIAKIILNRFSELHVLNFLLFSIAYLILFSVGYYYSSKQPETHERLTHINKIGKLGFVITFVYVLIAFSSISISEIISPTGYTGDYADSPRGVLSTLYLVAIWWYIYQKTVCGSRLHLAVIIVIIFFTGLNLLVLGSRLAVITGIISLSIFYGIYLRKTKPTIAKTGKAMIAAKLFTIITIIAIIMSSIGLLRSAEVISAEGILSIFAAESVFIYASVLTFFDNDKINLFSIPWDLLTGLIGSIPTFIFPEKAELFLTFSTRSEDAYSGFGGVHHLVSLLSNFGFVGFLIVSFVEGVCLGLLTRRVNVNAFYRAASLTSIGVLTFILYREGLQIPVKLLFFNFMILPFLAINFLLFIKTSVPTPSRSISRLVP